MPPSPSGPTVAADAASFRTVSICPPFAAGRMHRGGVSGSVAECRRNAAGAARPSRLPRAGRKSPPSLPCPRRWKRAAWMEARAGACRSSPPSPPVLCCRWRWGPFVAAPLCTLPPRYAPAAISPSRQPTGSGWGWAGRRGRPLPPCLVAAGAGRRRRGWPSPSRLPPSGVPIRIPAASRHDRRGRCRRGRRPSIPPSSPSSPVGRSPPVPSGMGGELDGGGRGGKRVEKGGRVADSPYILRNVCFPKKNSFRTRNLLMGERAKVFPPFFSTPRGGKRVEKGVH